MSLHRRTFAVPAALAARFGAGRGDDAAATARPAATVMLVRDPPGARDADSARPAGVQVFTLRRAATMAFAPDTTVFPGGGVDARDDDERLPWAGPGPVEWAEALGLEQAQARRLVVAAAREVFEECGVLLAGPPQGGVVADLDDPTWVRIRARLVAHELSFAQVLIDAGLVLRSDLLCAQAHWLTPTFEPRRYDTWFFAALLPAGHEADGRTSEAVSAAWHAPAHLLHRADAGEITVLPPTRVQLERLARASSAADVVARPGDLSCVQPWLEKVGDDVILVAQVPDE